MPALNARFKNTPNSSHRRSLSLKCGYFFRAGIIILEKSLFYKKPKSLFRTRTKYVASGLAIMVRKGLVGFYNLRVLGHFGKKGARCRDQPYGGRFFGRWRSSDLRSAKKATPYSLATCSRRGAGTVWTIFFGNKALRRTDASRTTRGTTRSVRPGA